MSKRKRSEAKSARVWFWSKREYVRFITAVEQLVASVNDLISWKQDEANRRLAAASRANATRVRKAVRPDGAAPADVPGAEPASPASAAGKAVPDA